MKPKQKTLLKTLLKLINLKTFDICEDCEFRKVTSIQFTYWQIRYYLYDEKKMHLTQWNGENSASNFHVKLPRKSLSMQIYQSYSESGFWKTWNNFDSSMKNDFWLKENCKLHTVRTWGKWLRNVFWAITSLLVVFPVTFFIVNMFYFIQKVNTLEWNSFWGSIQILHNRRQVLL